MPKKSVDPNATPSPEPALPDAFASQPADDSFTTPPAGDSFNPLTPDQEVSVWRELRELLTEFVARPALAADRTEADSLVRRLGLATELNPLFVVAVREAADLEKIITAGMGMEAKAAEIRRQITYYLTVTASDPETNREVAEARERFGVEFTEATRKADAASKAERQLRHLHVWLWPLFRDTSPFPETKNALGETIRGNRGALSSTIVPPQTDAAARSLGLNPFSIDDWKNLRKPEVQSPKRRFRTSPLSQPTTTFAKG